ncbi:MAG: acetyl-CoA hydrolase/transferase family protein [Acidaminococcales bacterium]|jgi:succinyl-CoA:acetate CoA-transferase|nr:acetyl-CoA hydrolase/transferase family protein [Acidaminococcales bacterium]
MGIEISDRIKNKALLAKVTTAEAAADLIKDGMNIGVSGFTPAGYPKAVPLALAKKVEAGQAPLKVNLWTGASVGAELDGSWAKAGILGKRLPYQTNNDTRNAINAGKVNYTDLHLSHVAQMSRYGFLGGGVDLAIIEACKITEDGCIVGTTSEGNSASFVQSAKQVIVEINVTQPEELEKMHDVYIPLDPPHRQPIPITKADDRIGTTYIPCDPRKIVAIVPCDIIDGTRALAAIDDDAKAMSGHLIEFLQNEIKQGRLPKNLLPLQSGVGSVANAVIAGLVDSPFENLSVYTEVVQDGMFDLIDAGKLVVASGTSLSPSPDALKRFYANIGKYLPRLILRPQEISNSPEIARRLGVIAMNTAIEYDIYGHVNSTHTLGTKMMNGIGGSGDFARNAYLTFFFTNSVAKKGDISSIVPMCSHIDSTEHDIDVFVTERGVADVRGLSPKERAKVIIEKTAHPDYQPLLRDYVKRAIDKLGPVHTPHLLGEALSFHTRFAETGSMKVK